MCGGTSSSAWQVDRLESMAQDARAAYEQQQKHDAQQQQQYVRLARPTRVRPRNAYAHDRHVWPFTVEQVEHEERLGNGALVVAALLAAYALAPILWWWIRAWLWSFR